MPFTAAHPAAVLPIVAARRWFRLDTTCLLIGSMAPDFEYFVRGELISTFSHSLMGVLVWGIPVTPVVAFLYHAVSKWPLLLVLPTNIAAQAIPIIGARWRSRWTIAALISMAGSAFIGNITHVAWDSITHRDGWLVLRSPSLTSVIEASPFNGLPVYRVLQHASSAIGLLALVGVTVAIVRRRPPASMPTTPRLAARLAFVASIVVFVSAALARLFVLGLFHSGHIFVASMSGLLAGVLVASALLSGAAGKFASELRQMNPTADL